MQDTQRYVFASATSLIDMLEARQISALELLEQHLERIKRSNPRLNAIVTINEEQARQMARQADTARSHGERRPLLGLPLTVKDTIDVQGLPTTHGDPAQAHKIAASDAGVVARLKAAGAVILGKTNVPLYAADWQTNNPLFGRSNNPWNPGYTPGGSTGGGAAAVAAGLTPLEIGSDIAGSIRIPAAFCGIYGHKPSEMLLPFSGHVSDETFPNAATPLGVQGPLTRSAEDLKLIMDVLTGRCAGQQNHSWSLSLPFPRYQRLNQYRIAVLPQIKWLPIDHEILEAQERFIARLIQCGVKVKEVQPEGFGDLRDYYDLFVSIHSSIASAELPDIIRYLHAIVYHFKRQPFYSARSRGLRASASDYIRWFARRENYRAAYRTFFKVWDILLTPVNIVNAFPHLDGIFSGRQLTINGQKVPYMLQSAYPALATLCGQPATTVPIGFTQNGLPIGLQAIGPYLEDYSLLHFVTLVEQDQRLR